MKRKIDIQRASAWLFLVAGYIFTMIFTVVKKDEMINSDMSAELMLGRQLSKEGFWNILSPDWYYSTEIKVFSDQLIYKFLFYFLGDQWGKVRIIGAAIMMIMLVAAYLYMAWAADFGIMGVWSAGVLMWPFGHWYTINVLFGAFYYAYLIVGFLTIGLLIRWIRYYREQQWFHKCILLILLCGVAFASGLMGVRQIMVTYLPVFVAAILCVFIHGGDIGSLREGNSPALLVGSFLALICSGFGYLINAFIFPKYYTFATQSEMYWKWFDMRTFLKVLGDLPALLGFHTYIRVASWQGGINFLSIFLGVLLVIALVRLIFRIRTLPDLYQVVLLYYVSAIIVCAFVFASYEDYNESYWLPVMPFSFAIIGMFLQTEDYIRTDQIRRYMINITCLLAIVLGSISVFISPHNWVLHNDKLVNHAELVNRLDELGYTKGYATFWEGAVLTELSDGKFDVYSISGWADCSINRWLQPKSYSDDQGTDRAFVIVSVEDLQKFDGSVIDKLENEYQIYGDGIVCAFGMDSFNEFKNILYDHQD